MHRLVISCGARKVRLGKKKKKRFVIFDGKHWHIPDSAQLLGENERDVWCQRVLYYGDNEDEDKKGGVYVNIGGIEIKDPRE